LGLAARERGNGLTEPKVIETDIDQWLQSSVDLAVVCKECQGFRDGHLQGIGNRLAANKHFQCLISESAALAVGAL